MPKVLCIYSASQTYTSTVFEHLDSFRKYSKNKWFYLDLNSISEKKNHLESFNIIALHYSVRLPFGQLSDILLDRLKKFKGLKILFIQDEYDFTNATKLIINSIQIDLVFTVVPKGSIERVYPLEEFKHTKFVSNLTGYVPDDFINQMTEIIPTSKRSLVMAYRGRPLPVRYGKLGHEKIVIGRHVKDYCVHHGITCDIEWDEASRIYGSEWYKFIGSAKAMLGSESGSNVFDWDGSLQATIDNYLKDRPDSKEEDIYRDIIVHREIDGLMNQISPRIFEMASAKTVMVLFEGVYSGVLEPNLHYLPLKKDFSNLKQIFNFLDDELKVNSMVQQAYNDIILSGVYSYKQFVKMVDDEIQNLIFESKKNNLSDTHQLIKYRLQDVTEVPLKAVPPLANFKSPLISRLVIFVWQKIPLRIRPFIKFFLGRL
jgi:hypothetical protein